MRGENACKVKPCVSKKPYNCVRPDKQKKKIKQRKLKKVYIYIYIYRMVEQSQDRIP